MTSIDTTPTLPVEPESDHPGWQQLASCGEPGVDPDVFFPQRGDVATATKAKRICADCVVRRECLEWALANHERVPETVFGIWGGTSERERRSLRRTRTLARRAVAEAEQAQKVEG